MTMVSTSKRRSDGTPYQHHVCTKKRAERSTCDCNTSISKSVIEGVFFATLMHLAKGNISKKDVASQQKQYGLDLEKELKVLNNSERAKKQELANLTKALSSLKPSSPLAKSLLETMQSLSEELEEIRLRKAEINKQLSIMEEIVDLDSLQLDSSLNNLDLLFEEMTEEEKILLVSSVVEKISLKVESVDGRKKYYSIMITPTFEYFSKLGVQVVEFCYDNSKGTGAWFITKPFKLESPKFQSVTLTKSRKNTKQKRHFIAQDIKLYKKFEKSNMNLTDFAASIGQKRAMLGRRFQIIKKLSASAIEFLLNLRHQGDTDKITFNKLEDISYKALSQQLSLIKKLIK